jgi:hypothetical protein
MNRATSMRCAAVLLTLVAGTASHLSAQGLSLSAVQGLQPHSTAGTWKNIVLDQGDYPTGPSIAIDRSGRLHICYARAYGPHPGLQYLTNATGVWQRETVVEAYGIDACDMQVDQSGFVHLLYDQFQDSKYSLKYINNVGGSWQSPASVNPVGYDPSFIGASLSVASDGKVHACTRSGHAPDYLENVVYLTNESGSWVADTIGYGLCAASMALDAHGGLHVAYYGKQGVLYQTKSGGTWQAPELVDSVTDILEGMTLDVAADSLGQPHIGYMGAGVRKICYAVRLASSWQITTVDSGTPTGFFGSVEIDHGNHPCVAYPWNVGILYARNQTGTWEKEVADPVVRHSLHPRLALDASDQAYICNSDYANGDYTLRLTTNAKVPILSVVPASLDFGQVNVGRSGRDTLTIRNLGDAPLTISGCTLTGPGAKCFSTLELCSSLQPGDSGSIIVFFTPDSLVVRSAALEIFSNDASSPQSVPLTGLGSGELNYWRAKYGGAKEDYPRSFCATADGGFIVAGRTKSSGAGGYDAWVVKLNRFGYIEWEKTMGGAGDDEAYSILQTPERAYVVAGYTRPYGGGLPLALVAKLDSAGQLLWQKTYANPSGACATVVRPFAIDYGEYVHRRGYRICGRDTGRVGLHFTVDPDGEITPDYWFWRSKFELGSFESVELTADTGVVFSIRTYYGARWNIDYGMYYSRSGEGRPSWYKYLSGTTGIPQGGYLRQISDHGFILTASSEGPDISIYVLRLDSLGSSVWRKEIRGLGTASGNPLATETSNGHFLIAAPPPSGNIVCLSPDGVLKWSRVVGEVADILSIADGSIAVVGPASDDMGLGKLDSTGQVPGCESSSPQSVTVTDFAGDLVDVNVFSFTPIPLNSEASTLPVQESHATRTIIECAMLMQPDDDGDGVANIEERGANGMDPFYDGNGDGIPDMQQNNAASFHTLEGYYVTLWSPPGTQLHNVKNAGNPSGPTSPDGAFFLLDFFDFSVTGIAPGGGTTVSLKLPSSLNSPTLYFKYGPMPDSSMEYWYPFMYDGTVGAEISGRTVTLHLVDGRLGDADLTANGTIRDPGGPAWPDTTTVAVKEKEELPVVYSLAQNYPNPFNPKTIIEYAVPPGANPHVLLQLFDLLGRVAMTLVDEQQGAGRHRVVVDASRLSSGVYFYRITAGSFMQAKKLVLLR